MENDNIIHGIFGRDGSERCCPDCTDLEQPLTLTLTPEQIIRCCFLYGENFRLTKDTYESCPNEWDLTGALSVDSEHGTCWLHREIRYVGDSEGDDHIYRRAVIDLDLGSVHIWVLYDYDEIGSLPVLHIDKIIDEDFMRACIILGERVAYQLVQIAQD